jgi:aminoglycoside/choline kinase family phosphotransferase
MNTRLLQRNEFINLAGWGKAKSKVVAGDASNRSYERLTNAVGKTAILMNAPPEKGEDVKPFILILNFLRKNELEAPELLYSDIENGFLLLEDLGDDLFARICLKSPELESQLYRAAVDVLVALHKAPVSNDIPPYDLNAYLRETDLVTDWYLPAATGQNPTQALIDEYRGVISDIISKIQPTNPVLVLRDYHAENLLWLPKRTNLKSVGLLDFQDALLGHPAYDLVSLLEDARRDTSNALQESMKAYFIEQSGIEKEVFNYAYAAIGAQRNLKIIGIFARLCIRDGKPHYVDLIPRVWAHLENDIKHPKLTRLKSWIETHVPQPTPEVLSRIKEARNAT